MEFVSSRMDRGDALPNICRAMTALGRPATDIDCVSVLRLLIQRICPSNERQRATQSLEIGGCKVRPIVQSSLNRFGLSSVSVYDFLSVNLGIAVLQDDHIAITVARILISRIPRPACHAPMSMRRIT